MSKEEKDKKSAAKKEAASKKEEKPKKDAVKKETAKKDDKSKKVSAPKKEAPKKDVSKKEVSKKEEPKKELTPKKDVTVKEEKPKVAPVKEEKKEPVAAVKEPKPKTVPTKEKPVEEKKEEIIPTYEGINLFNKWSYKDLMVEDLGLKAYISLRPVITPHTGGRYEHQRFKKAEMPIVERLVNKLMRTKKGTGKKERMIKSVKIAFEIIHLQTGNNPIQILIDAIQNTAPREEVTRITYGGMAQLQSVDVAPMRRVDIALTNIVEGVYKKAFNNILSAEEILAKELIDAANNNTSSFAVSKMQEIERIALSAR
ncbi:MAG TPA: 30S ribosomal protein S7 [candidate division Zixibacteria bacterium]|nr:30S ribosomal protein S7 [candidate division Zixibacteria bacterium]